MNELNATRRNGALQPLSNEHQDGLVFVTRVRQGLRKRTNIERLRKYVSWYWKNHVRPHFFQEEKILVPLISSGHSMVTQLKSEHDFIRELTIAIDQDPDPEDIKRLSAYIEAHIKWEEECFFPLLEKELSETELAIVAEKLRLTH